MGSSTTLATVVCPVLALLAIIATIWIEWRRKKGQGR